MFHNFTLDAGYEVGHRHGIKLLTGTQAWGHPSGTDLLISNHKHVRYLLILGSPDLGVHTAGAAIYLGTDVRCFELFNDFQGIIEVPVGDFFVLALVKESGDPFLLGKGVALVEMEGVVISEKRMMSELEDYRKAESVGAIVVRIDSRGATVVAAHEIYEQIRAISEEGKPYIIDFNSSFSFGEKGFFRRFLFPALRWVDYGGLLKLKERVFPLLMTPEEVSFLKRYNKLRKLWIFN